MTDAISACRRAIENGSKSFALASRLLPSHCRDAVVVLYAWCRRADDAVDRSPHDERPAAIVRLRAELLAIYRGELDFDDVDSARAAGFDPTLLAFAEVVRRHHIPFEYPSEMLAGMESDVVGFRPNTLEDLLLYCHRVAGTVGLMMCHVLGVRDASALRNAAHLGIAMQLTNVCRDIEEDWLDGRLYIPGSILCVAENARALPPPPAVARAVQLLLAHADRYYYSGDRGLGALSFRGALSVRAARLIYAAIGARLAKRDFDALSGRVVVPLLVKLALVVRALVRSIREIPRRSRDRFVPASLERIVRFPDDVLPI